MDNKSVIVLAPNGRRQTVKVTPNTTILQIIEEVCKKQGYDAKDYDLKHHRKVLDSTCSMRFSGLPNNAQLELVNAEKVRSESPVTIGIHLENGERIMGEFLPHNSVMDVLKKLCPDHANLDTNPVVIYMRREIYGAQALHNTTLKSLGLTGGRAVLRLIHRSPEELKTQANVSAPLPSTTKNYTEEPYIKKRNIAEVSPTRPTHHSDIQGGSQAENKTERNVQRQQQPQPLPMPKTDARASPSKDIVNFIKQEKEKRKSPETPRKSTESPPKPPAFTEQMPRKQADFKNPEPARISGNPVSSKRQTSPEPMDVDVGTSANKKVADEDFIFLGERNAIAFSQEMAQAVRTEDLPDDFFELTIDDAKKLIRDIKRTRMELENAQLETKAMRSLRESQKQLNALHKYKKAIIRIVFPDHTVLQGTFKPTETISHVADFVKEYLEDTTIHFYLYTSPPKEILRRESKLIETGCVPSAIVYFGTDTPRQDGKYLKKDVLNRLMSPSKASIATEKMRKESRRALPEDRINENTSTEDLLLLGPSTSTRVQTYEDYPARNPKPIQKTPKWYKQNKF